MAILHTGMVHLGAVEFNHQLIVFVE